MCARIATSPAIRPDFFAGDTTASARIRDVKIFERVAQTGTSAGVASLTITTKAGVRGRRACLATSS